MDKETDALERRVEALSNLSPKQLRQLLTPRPPKPKPLVIPRVDPASITETAEELAKQTEIALARLLGKHVEISRTTGDARILIWELNNLKAGFLPLAGKLSAVDPNRYAQLCSKFEHIFLSPLVPQERPPADPRDAKLIDKFCADRSYGHGERTRREQPSTTGAAPLTNLIGY